MQNKDARQILEKIRNGTATGEEKAIVESVYAKWMVKNQPELSDVELSNSLSDISRRLPIQRKRKFTPYALGAAASLVLLLFAALYFSSTRQVKDSLVKNDVVQDILPGSNKAILTLSNGIEVPLNDKKGQQDYTAKNPEAVKNDHGIAYNTITTPRGGQYQVLLPDGTHVWLNAASSIRFPLTFTKNERHVAITGEAYFEVTKNKHQPFVVTTGRQSIQVLGTHFNVMAYQDEPSINTTLLEGSVQVTVEQQSRLMKPGEQATLGKLLTVHPVDVADAIAWKNGVTSYNEANIKTIMRQVSRWYDVNVNYEGQVPDRYFTGSISRNSKLSELLKIFDLSDIHYTLKDHLITIKP